MEPRKPMLDRLYFDDDTHALSYWQRRFKESGFTSSTPEKETLRIALNGQTYFDAGTLPEVTIRPPKDNAVYKMGYMIPNKDLRKAVYDDIDLYTDIDQRSYINRLWNLYNKSQRPSIKSTKSLSNIIVPMYEKISGGYTDRANYSPITNTMYISQYDEPAEDLVAELSHAYQTHGTDTPRSYGWIKQFFTLPGDIKINGQTGYGRIGNKEFVAHSIIEPLFRQHLTNKDYQYEDMWSDIMKVYNNQKQFFNKTRQIKPLSKIDDFENNN